MEGIISQVQALGMTITDFCRVCPIAYLTLKRMDSGKSVRADLIARVRMKVEDIRTEQNRSHKAAV